MELISRQKAKSLGLKHYFTGKPCKYRHVSEKYVSAKTCCTCLLERSQKPEHKAKQAAYKQTPDAKAKRAARDQTPENKAYQAAHAKKPKVKAYQALWRKANPHINTAVAAQYRAAKLERTPKWLTQTDKAAIKAIYEQCAFTSRVTGEPHHVDHIYPLQGETVSGLHVPINLQILTAEANVKKSNKLLDDPFLQ